MSINLIQWRVCAVNWIRISVKLSPFSLLPVFCYLQSSNFSSLPIQVCQSSTCVPRSWKGYAPLSTTPAHWGDGCLAICWKGLSNFLIRIRRPFSRAPKDIHIPRVAAANFPAPVWKRWKMQYKMCSQGLSMRFLSVMMIGKTKEGDGAISWH